MINKDEAQGKVDQLKGKAKQKVGEWTGDRKMQDEGIVDEASGHTQEKLGTAKRKVGEAIEDLGERIRK